MFLKIKRLSNDGLINEMPKYQTSGSAGFDLCAFCKEDILLKKGERILVSTGICVEIESGYLGLVCARSGLSIKNGITLANGVGVIDSDYRGEIKVGLYNISSEDFIITNGQRIAQMVIMPSIICELLEVSDISDTKRGVCGFGSTGE